MKNIISFDDFEKYIICERMISFSERKEEETSTEYNRFSDVIIKSINNAENKIPGYEWSFEGKKCLIINDKELADKLKTIKGCEVYYIHMSKEGTSYDGTLFSPDFRGDKIINENEFYDIISSYLKNTKKEDGEDIKPFDIVINVSIPIYSDGKLSHPSAEKVAKINNMIFNASIVNNDGIGIDRTLFYTLDDKFTYNAFNKLINKGREKYIMPANVKKISDKESIKYGFDVAEERLLMRIFVRSVGTVKADNLDDSESKERGEKISADGMIVGRTNPNIYCFTTPNVNSALKVGDTFRPIHSRMDEWRKVFGSINPLGHWSAVENNWVFRDYTVHKYLKNMGKERLNKNNYDKYFTPMSEAYTMDNTYSSEFFLNTEPSDVERAIIQIKKDIRDNIDLLRDSLKKLDKGKEEDKKFFFNERQLQKDAIDNFVKRISSNDDDSRDFLIYAVMRFGKTYTAIRCLQEFYKIKDNVTNFSLITTAKPEVKNEWIGGFKKYYSDKIDEEGKRHDKSETGENLTDRNFEDFLIYTVDELDEAIREELKLKDDDLGWYDIGKKKVLSFSELNKAKKKVNSFIKEGSLKIFIDKKAKEGKHVVLFTSLQDLSGSNGVIKNKHIFFYDYPIDMMILDETHFAVRGKSLGVATGTTRKSSDMDEEDDVDIKSISKKEKDAIDKLNKLSTKDTIRLHLSGTPYNILKRKEFSDENILAAFTSTHLRLAKEKWEKDNEPLRIKWEEEQKEKRDNGDSDAMEEWENPYSADKNPYFGIPKMIMFGYELSKFELESIKETDENDALSELFRVVDDEGRIITTKDYKDRDKKEKLPDIHFVHEEDVIKLFRIVDGDDSNGEVKNLFSVLDLPEVKKGNLCKNILIALPFKDSCDALAEILSRTDEDGNKLFKVLGNYDIINAAGRRTKTSNPLNVVKGKEEKTITLTSTFLLTGVTCEPWDTILYMKDGKAPEPYDQAKFRIQSPYINELPIFDPDVLTSGKKPPILKQDMKPQTLFVDFKRRRMLELLENQMDVEYTTSGIPTSKILETSSIAVLDGKHFRPMTGPEFGDIMNDLHEKEKGDTGYKRLLKKIHYTDRIFNNEELMDIIADFHDFTNNKSSGDGWDEPVDGETETPTIERKRLGGGSKKGSKVKNEKKPSEEKIKEAKKKKLESIINGMAIYTILRKDTNEIRFTIGEDIIGNMIKSISNPINKKIVHSVFFNNNFEKTDEQCVNAVLKLLRILKEEFDKNAMTRRGLERTISKVDSIMNGDDKNSYTKVIKMFDSAGNNKLGKSEMISPEILIKKIVDSDFVIFNSRCKVLDAYGSKIGEFANYILNNDEVHRTKGIVNPNNYYILCYTPLIYEFNKFIAKGFGIPEKNIIFCNKVSELKKVLKGMTFDIIVGNPPYQGKGNPLYMRITKALYDNNMDKDSIMCMINPTGLVDNLNEDNPIYKTNFKEYSYLNLIDFYYDKNISGVFTSADIGNDIGIFTYKKVNEEDKSLYSDWVKIKRFGEDFSFNKGIIDIINSISVDNVKDYDGFIHCHENAKKIINKFPTNRNYVVCSFNRGHKDNKNGGNKWDWVTLFNDINLLVQKKLPAMAFTALDFNNDIEEATKWIKWLNTDFVMFIVNYYKYSISNPPTLYSRIPQPPTSGDFSDKSLMKEFGLDKEQMKHIHEKMKDYGWKTKTNSYFEKDYQKAGYKLPSVKLDGTEERLLEYIEELNRINDGIEIDSSKVEADETSSFEDETRMEVEADDDSWKSHTPMAYDD